MTKDTKGLVKKSEQTMQRVAPGELVVFARNPVEMEQAQEHLINWSEAKITELQLDHEDLKQNLAIAVKHKWKTEPWRRRISIAVKRITFQEKVLAAIRSGYCLVPNFPVQVFAVRTTRKTPKGKTVESNSWTQFPQESNMPALGDGRYVDSFANVEDKYIDKYDKNGHVEEVLHAFPHSFDEEIDFPLSFAKPQVLDATGKALALKIFDEIGVLPQNSKREDPVIVGTIKRKEGYTETVMTFLISWFVDTRHL